MRFLAEFEVEVIDPIQAAAFTMDWGRDADGGVQMMPHPTEFLQMNAAVSQAMAVGLMDAGPQAGFRWLGGSVIPRVPLEDGTYGEVTLPKMPGRRDDGELIEPS